MPGPGGGFTPFKIPPSSLSRKMDLRPFPSVKLFGVFDQRAVRYGRLAVPQAAAFAPSVFRFATVDG
jgi:hypothetical protein